VVLRYGAVIVLCDKSVSCLQKAQLGKALLGKALLGKALLGKALLGKALLGKASNLAISSSRASPVSPSC